MSNVTFISSGDLIHTSVKSSNKIKNIKEFLLTNIYIDNSLEHSQKYSIGYDNFQDDYFIYARKNKYIDKGITVAYVFIYKTLGLTGSYAIINREDKSVVVMQNSHILKVYSFDISYETILSMIDVSKIYIVNEKSSDFETIDINSDLLKQKYIKEFSNNERLNITIKNYKPIFYASILAFIIIFYLGVSFYSNFNEYKQIQKSVKVEDTKLTKMKNELDIYESLSSKKLIPHIYNILNKLNIFKVYVKNIKLDNTLLHLSIYARFDGNILEYFSYLQSQYKISSSRVDFIDGFYLGDVRISFE